MARGTNKILHQMFLKMIKQNGEMMFINFANICVENIPSSLTSLNNIQRVDPGFFLGGNAPLRNDVTEVFLQNTSSVKKPHVISGGQNPCTLPLDLPQILLQCGKNASKFFFFFFFFFFGGGTLCSHFKV